MSETTENPHGYPFLADWLARQAEPVPDFGMSVFDDKAKSPLALDQLPGRQNETLFERGGKKIGEGNIFVKNQLE